MELHAPDGVILVAQAHDLARLRFGGDLQAIRHGVPLHYERMISRGGKRARDTLEQILAVMGNRRGLTVHHHVVHHHLRAKRMRNALVPEAHAH